MASGTVKWFTDASDYGFVVPDEIGGDLCARGSNVDAAMGTRLTEGDRAEFRARVAGMRPEAIEVLPLRARQDLRCACGYGIVASVHCRRARCAGRVHGSRVRRLVRRGRGQAQKTIKERRSEKRAAAKKSLSGAL
jgi:cold shock CspA family protein